MNTNYSNMYKNGSLFGMNGLRIKRVIFNEPATIVYWDDGEKTVVKCKEGERFDPEKGLAIAISKKGTWKSWKLLQRVQEMVAGGNCGYSISQ